MVIFIPVVCFQNKGIYLLDDPFASLDSKVGRFVWDEAVVKRLRGRGKLVIVATHRTEFLEDADEVLVLNSTGSVLRQGNFCYYFFNWLFMYRRC